LPSLSFCFQSLLLFKCLPLLFIYCICGSFLCILFSLCLRSYFLLSLFSGLFSLNSSILDSLNLSLFCLYSCFFG
jgi:hypothetical protein